MAAPRIALDVPQVKTRGKRWIVVGAGARDEYQVPAALHEADLLERFFTDFYAPLDRVAFGRLIPSALQKRLQRRFAPELPQAKSRRALTIY